MNVAWRNLTRDRGRVLVSAGGVGFAVLLILLLRSLYAGILDSSTRFVRGVEDHSDESVVWVAQKGTPGRLLPFRLVDARGETGGDPGGARRRRRGSAAGSSHRVHLPRSRGGLLRAGGRSRGAHRCAGDGRTGSEGARRG